MHFCFTSKNILLFDDHTLCHLKDGTQQSFFLYPWLTYISSCKVYLMCHLEPHLSGVTLPLVRLLFASSLSSAFGSISQSGSPFSFCLWWTLSLGKLQVLWVMGLDERWKEQSWTWDSNVLHKGKTMNWNYHYPIYCLSWQIFKIMKTVCCWYWPIITKKKKNLVGDSLTMFLFFLPILPKTCVVVP